MRLKLIATLAIGFVHSATAAEIPAASRIEAATVFLSGAEVTRTSKVKIDKGEHVVVFSDLAAETVTGSIRVEGKADGKLEIGSVDSRKVWVPRSAGSATERRALETEIDRLRDRRAGEQGRLDGATTQKTLIGNLAELPKGTGGDDTTPGAARAQNWPEILGVISAGMADATKTAIDAQIALREIDRQIADMENKVAQLPPDTREQTEVRIFVSAAAPLEAELSVRYQVANAAWSPLYDARLSTGSKNAPARLDLARRAEIRQRTGEAWDEITLQLSTARPSASSAIPEVTTVSVDFEPEAKPVAMEQAAPRPYARKVMPGRGEGDDAGASMDLQAAPPAPAAAAPQVEVENVAVNAVTLPFQALFDVPGRTTVTATGEPKRVELLQNAIDPQLRVRTAPKLDEKAFLYAKIVLPKGPPAPPGPVSLFRDGTFVGTAQLPILSPGEDHELGFGVDDLVRVRYIVVDEKRGETGLISTSRTDLRNYRVQVKSMHERPIALTVLEQLPVSRNDDIKVELVGRTQPTLTDVDGKRGVVAFETILQPDAEQVIEFGYRVTWPSARSIIYGP